MHLGPCSFMSIGLPKGFSMKKIEVEDVRFDFPLAARSKYWNLEKSWVLLNQLQ